MNRKVLIIQPTFDTHGPRNIRTLNLIPYFIESSYKVSIICFESFAIPRSIEGVSILRLPLSFLNKYFFQKDVSGFKPRGLVRLISRGCSFLLKRFWFPDNWLLEHKKVLNTVESFDFDFIIASVLPFSNCELALKIKEKCKPSAKVIFDIGDPLSNNSMQNRNFNEKKLFHYEKNILEQSDYIVVTNTGTKDYYKYMGLYADNIKVIPQGVNIDTLKLTDSSPPISQKIVMIYAGTFYPELRDSGPFVQALNILDSSKIKINFFGVSNNIGLNCSNTEVNYFDRVNQDELALYFSASNVLLYFDNAFGIQTSGKIYELVVLKKLIIFIYSNDESPVFKEFKDYKNIIFVKNNSEAIKEAILRICDFSINPNWEYEVDEFKWKSRAREFINILN